MLVGKINNVYLEFDHIENGDEGLSVDNGGVMWQSSEDGRLHVVARAVHYLAN